MSILVGLHHATRYDYDRPVSLGPQIVRLRPGAALPHPHSELFAHGKARPAFRELAAGSARQLARAFRIPGEDERIFRNGRSPRRYGSDQSLRLLRRALRGNLAVRISRPSCVRTSRPSSNRSRAGPRLKELVRSISREQRNTVDFLVELNQRLQQMIRYLIRMEPGVQTPEETLAVGRRLLPRHGVAAGAAPASHRPAGALRVRLSHPAQAGHEAARRRRRRRRTTSPTCTPGPRSICRARAGSGSIRPRDCSAARATCRSPRRRISAPPRRSADWSSPPRFASRST